MLAQRPDDDGEWVRPYLGQLRFTRGADLEGETFDRRMELRINARPIPASVNAVPPLHGQMDRIQRMQAVRPAVSVERESLVAEPAGIPLARSNPASKWLFA
jgi:hypothetical protein